MTCIVPFVVKAAKNAIARSKDKTMDVGKNAEITLLAVIPKAP